MRTFVVRLQDSRTGGLGADALCGVADEIATGRRQTFTSGGELLRMLAAADPAAGAPPGPERSTDRPRTQGDDDAIHQTD